MDEDLDEGSAFDALDEEIAVLLEARAGCRRAILASRAAIGGGCVTLLLSLLVVALRAPTVAVAAVTAVIGGLVWAGASATSGAELDARLADAQARRAALFDAVAARNGWRDITPTVH